MSALLAGFARQPRRSRGGTDTPNPLREALRNRGGARHVAAPAPTDVEDNEPVREKSSMEWLNLTAIGTATLQNAMQKFNVTGYISGMETDGNESAADEVKVTVSAGGKMAGTRNRRHTSTAHAAGSLRNAMLARGGITRMRPLDRLEETSTPPRTEAANHTESSQATCAPTTSDVSLSNTALGPKLDAAAEDDDSRPKEEDRSAGTATAAEAPQTATAAETPETELATEAPAAIAAEKLAPTTQHAPSASALRDDVTATPEAEAVDCAAPEVVAEPASEALPVEDSRGVEGGTPASDIAEQADVPNADTPPAERARVNSAPASVEEKAPSPARTPELEPSAPPKPPPPVEAGELQARLQARRKASDGDEERRVSFVDAPNDAAKRPEESRAVPPKAVRTNAWIRKPVEEPPAPTPGNGEKFGPPKAARRTSWVRQPTIDEVEQAEPPEVERPKTQFRDMKEFWSKSSKGFAGPALGQGAKISKTEAQAALQRLIASGNNYDEVRRLRKLVDQA